MIGEVDRRFWNREKMVVGFDEAGRGPIAGDMFFSLVELYPLKDFPFELKDSKKYSDKKRFKIEEDIRNLGLIKKSFVGTVPVTDINAGSNLNSLLHNAVFNGLMCMLNGINMHNVMLLVDGNQQIRNMNYSLQFVQPKLDENSWSCAVASILAKNSQVRVMHDLDKKYPEYGFTSHKGYGTKKHYEAIRKYGTCEVHRVGWIK